MPLLIAFGSILILALLFFILSTVAFLKVFYSPKRRRLGEDEFVIPKGKIYEEYRSVLVGWMKDYRALPYTEEKIVSHDGLTLRGRYYEFKKDAPTEILFHGYRGTAERDMSAGISRCFAVGRNALIVDQRASGESDGRVISFGINERLDCLTWVKYARERLGENAEIIISGISMGAATVMMASELLTRAEVKCILADCGYSSPREIIRKVIKDMGLPPFLIYPAVRFGGLVFGGFDVEKFSCLDAVGRTDIPIIFIHGDADDFVPYEMSERLYGTCSSLKKLVAVEGAGHGLAYPRDKEKYISAVLDFEKEWRESENLDKNR